MVFNVLLFISQATAQIDVSTSVKRSLTEEPHYQLEDSEKVIRDPVDERKDQVAETLDLCGEIQGRKLLRKAIIGIPLGTVTTIGGGILFLASIDSGTSLGVAAIGTVFAGLGTLAFSAVALPVSAHILHRDAVQKEVDPIIPIGTLYMVDGVIVMGYIVRNFGHLLSFTPNAVLAYATLGIPIGYTINGIQLFVILDSIRKEQKRVCGKTI